MTINPTKKMHCFRMHPYDIQLIQRMAEQQGCTQIAILEKALRKYFSEYELSRHRKSNYRK